MEIMKVLATTLLVTSFVAVSVFGILAMDHGDGMHLGCIGAATAGEDCPRTNPFDFVLFHLHIFQNFSTAIPVPGILTGALLLVLATVFGILLYLVVRSVDSVLRAVDHTRRRGIAPMVVPPVIVAFRDWLALHERGASPR